MDDRYMQEVKQLIPVDVDVEDLVTLARAAEMLEVTVQSVAGAVDGGSFDTVIIDTEVTKERGSRGRRLLLRGEVMERMLRF